MERKQPKGEDLIKAGQLDFLTTEEGMMQFDIAASKNGYPSSEVMLADQGSNGSGKETNIIKPIRSVKKAVRTLNKNIRNKQGDVGFALHAMMMKDG